MGGHPSGGGALVVAGDGPIRPLQLEVGAGGVEEQQIDLEDEEFATSSNTRFSGSSVTSWSQSIAR
ncbi:hypothetical protein QFZ24_000025 [Streptomyces phaeochromogenes]|jgi:hypothetical protein|uniref:Uncharacterized protein n=1 Tax=Streptomyces umbrinus TaxID=67370 RepID=A0ABU0SGD9_9ACTN|nr:MULTISPECIES: hypothetical protein [Streptomyces phaeochromogenes group]MDQ0946102.1 hypothetical protein [Streptomyces phaeochromogenes]MDQ1022622.1 hypothetical protein [Streptomyces umbrinus]